MFILMHYGFDAGFFSLMIHCFLVFIEPFHFIIIFHYFIFIFIISLHFQIISLHDVFIFIFSLLSRSFRLRRFVSHCHYFRVSFDISEFIDAAIDAEHFRCIFLSLSSPIIEIRSSINYFLSFGKIFLLAAATLLSSSFSLQPLFAFFLTDYRQRCECISFSFSLFHACREIFRYFHFLLIAFDFSFLMQAVITYSFRFIHFNFFLLRIWCGASLIIFERYFDFIDYSSSLIIISFLRKIFFISSFSSGEFSFYCREKYFPRFFRLMISSDSFSSFSFHWCISLFHFRRGYLGWLFLIKIFRFCHFLLSFSSIFSIFIISTFRLLFLHLYYYLHYF